MSISYKNLPFHAWVIIAVLLLSQSIWIFRDAQKRNTIPWLWGLWALTTFPVPLIVYLVTVRKIFRKIS